MSTSAVTDKNAGAAASSLSTLRVADAMHPGVITCQPEDRLARLASIMVTHGMHAVVVAALDESPPLIVTDRELIQAALEQGDAVASHIAREPIVSLRVDAPLKRAVSLMAQRYVAHLLVTDPSSDAPAGVISSFDIAAVVGGQNPRYARMLRPAQARPAGSAHTLTQARAAEVMHPGVITCPADAALSAVARSMADYRVHCIALAGVGGTEQRLTWGLVGDMDVVRALHRGAIDEPARSIASTEPIAVQEDESLERVAALMVEHDTSHVVVVDRSGLPAGIISTLDVAAILAGDG